MTTLRAEATPEISVIIPVVERHGNLAALFAEYAAEIAKTGRTAEYIFVVDRREASVLPTLRDLQRSRDEDITIISLAGRFGESASLTVGIQHAKGEILVTVAAYFQVDPAGIGPALDAIDGGTDLVIGSRSPRIDSYFNRLQTWLFHCLVNALSDTSFRDISSGFRVFRRAVGEAVVIYGGLHRFLPILALQRGFRVEEIQLQQRKEDTPTRYYGVAVYVKRLLDILTVFFLTKFTQRPLRFFGLVGLAISAVGFLITGYLGIYRLLHLGSIANRPLLLLGVLLLVLGIQSLSIGLVGEIIIFTHARSERTYRIAEIITQDRLGADRTNASALN